MGEGSDCQWHKGTFWGERNIQCHDPVVAVQLLHLLKLFELHTLSICCLCYFNYILMKSLENVDVIRPCFQSGTVGESRKKFYNSEDCMIGSRAPKIYTARVPGLYLH